jgi:hypothetical protein
MLTLRIYQPLLKRKQREEYRARVNRDWGLGAPPDVAGELYPLTPTASSLDA